jgi:hypothetical protein
MSSEQQEDTSTTSWNVAYVHSEGEMMARVACADCDHHPNPERDIEGAHIPQTITKRVPVSMRYMRIY